MTEKQYITPLGTIRYWINMVQTERTSLVLLPGLTADHRLFDKQVEDLAANYNLLVWDAPGHGLSRPFALTFSLEDKARWLHRLIREFVEKK